MSKREREYRGKKRERKSKNMMRSIEKKIGGKC